MSERFIPLGESRGRDREFHGIVDRLLIRMVSIAPVRGIKGERFARLGIVVIYT